MTAGLYLNALLLAAMLLVLLGRGNTPNLLPAAMAQQAPMPIAGGGGFFLMPAQFTASQWGTYVMDVDAQTLSAYIYDAGSKQLRFVAGRSFVWDRQIKRYNTTPAPEEIEALVKAEKDRAMLNGPAPATMPAP
jgi:hypothetical protein